MIPDLMVQMIEAMFELVDLVSNHNEGSIDKASTHMAHETTAIGPHMGVAARLAPGQRPESNITAMPPIKTFGRHYVSFLRQFRRNIIVRLVRFKFPIKPYPQDHIIPHHTTRLFWIHFAFQTLKSF